MAMNTYINPFIDFVPREYQGKKMIVDEELAKIEPDKFKKMDTEITEKSCKPSLTKKKVLAVKNIKEKLQANYE